MTILEKIVARKKLEIEVLPQIQDFDFELRTALKGRGETRDFVQRLRGSGAGEIALIAEVKKASPSKGVIRPNFDPVEIAREYEASGASCLSVLTDRDFFQGSLEYMATIREQVSLPILRKDFMIDSRQILEAIRWGADAVLLIAAILDDRQLEMLFNQSREAGLSVLVEVHNIDELRRVMKLRPELVGVNNRNLQDFSVSLETTIQLGKILEAEASWSPILVSESGIHTRKDVEYVRSAGARAILVGESLMRSKDIGASLRDLLGRE